ncbi:Putative membrane protein insertion efficiency factor [Klebsiella spallanzanii]|jgi:putative component of membrane protein insertase Oxa1/YidC/SpoIIIJ protein YidD|uniref:Membrane protein insertion efficiency factor n=1 Tax=Klebsiella spallanzanii TaxID=2587528 RepID=A0A564ISV5_9ENTR|nr:membrane protein insertion efficiency factor YidD [Klebsiella spallanzanii]MDM4208351.1 membrane protein insertion efficiency factor YidD [Klebsiella spallanzanii]VUS47649.1 Putative membrane protein insertion efficiency factor [Klebsiella spallanzanii]VUS98700.1 Putative membrane protein insertion efficiency factor [Klebsiella spallanzanii]
MNNLILKLIVFYQRVISPRKGYRCAYGVLHHTQGCSGAVKEIIQRKGVIGGRKEIRQRFADCRLAAEALQKQKPKDDLKRKKRRSHCDVSGCDGQCCTHLVPDSLPEIPLPDFGCPCDCASLRFNGYRK